MNNITENCSNCLHSCGTDNLYCSKHNKQVSDSEICFEYSHENSAVKLRKYFINKVGQYMDIDEMFDAFWKAYPRKLDKIKARKAFKKLNPSEKLFNTI